VVRSQTEAKAFEKMGKLQGPQIILTEFSHAVVRNLLNSTHLLARGKSETIATTLVDGLIAR
jgi:hypothetical protein